MGLFSSKKHREDADHWDAQARSAERQASEAASKAARHRQRLDSGTSSDREFDRYKLRESEEDRRLAAANARDFRQAARQSRKAWF